jgi:uncharacterized membrane protein YhaH (DUF805 family)
MSKRYPLFFEFNRRFARYAFYLKEPLVLGLFFMALGGTAIAKIESISLGDGIYFAFITGLTIGYGDIVPETTWGRVLSVVIGLIGTLFAGLTVAIASRALHDTVQHSGEVDH